ncbi:hypothetical protein Lbir_1063 [Legionella birminghamensis]|uniref:Uncharacterized protein n=1 Tax=Legionella birminghamensis TaxID=28083 RepID=A0A378I7W1_9GAMM|nr:hypothetical protein Lbir_1063 [Legionella birminghamensis]STX30701.1 Uncharacterised protein [Legionella birminghamensis]
MFIYTATVYFDSHIISTRSSDDLDDLFIWMLIEGDTNFGDSSGQIINNTNHEVVKKFRKNSFLN